MAVVFVSVAAGTMAYFNDTETSRGNTFTAGTIDIAVDQQNPWTKSYTVTYGDSGDLKPCESGVIEFTISNVGTNPAVLWKHLGVVSVDTGSTAYEGFSSEPEWAWAQAENYGEDRNDINTMINYDMSVGGKVIFLDEDGLTVDDIQCMWMPIGTLPAGESVTVVQSYHLKPETGNWAQGDVMTFTLDLYAEQRMGPGPDQISAKLFMDNKTGDPDWYFVVDQTWGILDWTAGTGAATLLAQGLDANAGYTLITYADPWPNAGYVTIGAGTSDASGKLTLTGLTVPSPYDGKIWLVPSSNVDGTKMIDFTGTKILFESNLVSIP